MQNIKRTLAAIVFSTAIAGGTFAFLGSPLVPSAQAHLKDHPKLQRAYDALRDAKEEVNAAGHDYRGHKEEALHSIDEAMEKISLAVADAEKRPNLEPRLLASHPKLREAKASLKEARQYIHEAKGNFNGHKDEVVKAIDNAVHHINLLMDEKD